jgi:hypothetical protein
MKMNCCPRHRDSRIMAAAEQKQKWVPPRPSARSVIFCVTPFSGARKHFSKVTSHASLVTFTRAQ